jgi:hypothetical protein
LFAHQAQQMNIAGGFLSKSDHVKLFKTGDLLANDAGIVCPARVWNSVAICAIWVLLIVVVMMIS